MLHKWQRGPGSGLTAVQWHGVIYTYGQLDWLGADWWPRQPFLFHWLFLTHRSLEGGIFQPLKRCCFILCSFLHFRFPNYYFVFLISFKFVLISFTFHTVALYQRWAVDTATRVCVLNESLFGLLWVMELNIFSCFCIPQLHIFDILKYVCGNMWKYVGLYFKLHCKSVCKACFMSLPSPLV